MAWNPNVPAERRIKTEMKKDGRPVPKVTHVVLHITGTDDFESAKNTYLTSVSPHYVVDKAGLVYQFVEEENQAWHAGIRKDVQPLYAKPPATWRKYLFYFSWSNAYPSGSKFLDADLNPVPKSSAVFVQRADGSEWPNYDYFISRWGATAGPVNYNVDKRPNAYSVGIEMLSVGAKTPSASVYTPEMYASLRTLVADVCSRHGIPMRKGTVLGHEDVNPIQRFGWDPNQGFDWSQVWE